MRRTLVRQRQLEPKERQGPDWVLLLTVLILVAFGLIMVFSSSSYSARVRFGDSFYFFRRQGTWALLGLVAMMVVQRIPYTWYRKYTRLFLWVGFGMLALSILPGIGVVARGSQRAFMLGNISVSPAEIIKLCIIIYLAHAFCRAPQKMRRFWSGSFPHLVVVVVAAGMVMLQPDLGTAVTILGTAFLMLYAAGAPGWHLVAIVSASLPVIAGLVAYEPYRLRRFLAFLNPWDEPLGAGFHSIQSLYALGSGQLLGVGLGGSRHGKFLYLPEQHTDFIFAIIGEELGLLGCIFVLTLFALLLWRGMRLAVAAPDAFGSLLAAGITAMILLQAAINIGVVASVLPVTGIPLPFISYGGSSLMMMMISVGILLNISRYAKW